MAPENFKGSHRTANFYMQLARDYGGDPQRVADLSLREAVQALREADRAGDTVEPRDGRDRQAREASRRKHGGWVGGADLARLDSLLRDARTVARAALTIFDVAEDAVRMAEPARRALRKHGAKTVNDLPAEVQAKVPQFGDLIFYDWGELAARMEEALKLMETALKLVRPVTVTITKGTRRCRSSGRSPAR